MDDARKALNDAIAQVDWTQTRSVTLTFERGAVPFSIPIRTALKRARFTSDGLKAIAQKAEDQASTESGVEDGRQRVTLEPGANIAPDGSTGDPGDADERPIEQDAPQKVLPPARTEVGEAYVEGVASSTSVDFYGTDMSVFALNSMAKQFKRGIPYLPRHNYGLFGASIEWDEVIGRTVDAKVDMVDAKAVACPYDEREPQAVLVVTSLLYPDESKALSLVRRVDRGEPIGQSIGGWFTELAVTTDEEGEVARVQVLDVELDHLAVTRAPANPDSDDLVAVASLRSISGLVRSAVDARRKTTVVENDDGSKVETTEGDRKTAPAMATCARSEQDGGRTVISFETGAPDGAIRDALQSAKRGELGPDLVRVAEIWSSTAEAQKVDEKSAATYAHDVQAPSGDDARRSALPLQPKTFDADPVVDSPESTMPELTPDALRQLFREEVAPLSQRLDALEGRSAKPPTNHVPAPAPAAETIDWEARAKAAEQAVAHLARGERVGRSVPMGLPSGAQGRATYAALIERTRADAPTLAATAEDVGRQILSERGVDPEKVTRGQLEASLADVINAAEIDGIITNPYTRALSAWR